MDYYETSQTIRIPLQRDGNNGVPKTGNLNTCTAKNKNTITDTNKRSTTDTGCSRTWGSITSQFQTVSIQNKRKLKSSEVYSTSKIMRNEQKDVDIEKDKVKEGKINCETVIRHHHSEPVISTRKRNSLIQLLKKDRDGDTILHLSIVHHDVIKSKSLIEIMSGKSLDVVNKLQQTPLHLSVLTCQPVLVAFLIFHGASVNMGDRNGQTPLHLASKNADIDCVKAIKDASESERYSPHIVVQRPDLNFKNFEGQAAFHLAVLSGSREIAKTLLDMKSNINIQDGTCGRTALHLAVESHNINMVNFLLENGANVNATTFSGNTALHLASGLCMDQLVHVLIRNGANINITNIEGDAPLYVKIDRSVRWKPPNKPQMKTIQQTKPLTVRSSRTTNHRHSVKHLSQN